MEKTTVIIPAFNEALSIRPLVERILALPLDLEILVVDDASTDGTAEALDGLENVSVIRHPANRGNGAAVKTALRQARTEWCLIIDADGQHDPEDIPRLLQALEQADMAVAARTNNSDSTGFRNFGNSVFNRLGGTLTGVEIKDMPCGFRAFRRSRVLPFYSLYPNGFSFPTTSTMCLLTTGHAVSYVPIDAKRRAAGSKSKIRPWRDGLKFLIIILRIIMFNPLKVFLPLGLGVLWTLKTLYFTSSLSAGGLLLLLSGVFFTFFGFTFDQIMALRRDMIMRDIIGRQ